MKKTSVLILSVLLLVFITGTIASFAEEKSIVDYLEDLNAKLIPEEKIELPAVSNTNNSENKTPPVTVGTVSEQVEQSLVARLNTLRSSLGARELNEESSLRTLARDHSKYQYGLGGLTHIGPGGDVGSRVGSSGWTYGTVGENVGYCDGYYSVETIASCIMSGWVGSQGHYVNMKNSSFSKVGIGVYGENGKYYATQIFVG